LKRRAYAKKGGRVSAVSAVLDLALCLFKGHFVLERRRRKRLPMKL